MLQFLIFWTSSSQGTAIRDRIQESLRGQPAVEYETSSAEEDDVYGDGDEYYYDGGDLNDEEEYYESDLKCDDKT